MENGDLIGLLENLLGPATAGVEPPQQGGPFQGDGPLSSYFDKGEEKGSGAAGAPGASRASRAAGMAGAMHPTMTGLFSAVMPIGIAIVETSSLRVVRLNKMLLQMLGVKDPVESMTGRPLNQVDPALGAPELLSALNQVTITGSVFSAILTDGTASPSGEVIYRRCTISPLRQSARSNETLLVTLLDVTEQVVTRRRMEEAVAAAQEQARRLQEQSSFMNERIRQVEEQASARLQRAIKQHEERVRLAADQAGGSLEQLRQLEQQLRLTTDQKRQLESTVLMVNDGARSQMEQAQRELEDARQEIERLRRDPGLATRDPGSPSTQAAALSSLVRELTSGATAAKAFSRAAEIVAEALGDICGIFLASAEGRLLPVAFYHREPQTAAQLSAFYTQHPLRPGEGLVGQVVRQGMGIARESVVASDMQHILPGLGEGSQALGITSVACAPLRGALEPIGAILLLSTRRTNGGNERASSDGVLGALNQHADAIALAAHIERLRQEVELAEAQSEAVFAGMTDGVAIYDRLGRLRHVNAVAEKLLSPPLDVGSGARPILQGFLDERGAPLSGDTLPWMRALRGDGPLGAVERVIATWEGGARRPLLLKALPARDASGAVAHAVVILRPDEPQAAGSPAGDPRADAPDNVAPSPPNAEPRADAPASGSSQQAARYCEVGEICARVARTFGTSQKRRIEARLPHRKVLLAIPEADVERAIVALIEAAAITFPASAPLQMSLVVEPTEGATARPKRYSAGPLPAVSGPTPSGRERQFVATIQVTGSQAGPIAAAAAPFLDQMRSRAAAFGGVAWVYEETGRETLFLLRAPVAHIER
jgi:PAS domain-containing protein